MSREPNSSCCVAIGGVSWEVEELLMDPATNEGQISIESLHKAGFSASHASFAYFAIALSVQIYCVRQLRLEKTADVWE